MTELEAMFEAARKLYPGEKRGFQKEYQNFRSKYRMQIREIVPLMIPNITRRIAFNADCDKRDMWRADWPHFKTWINQGRWEQEPPVAESTPKRRVQTCMFCNNPSTVRMDTKGARCSSDECKRRFNEL